MCHVLILTHQVRLNRASQQTINQQTVKLSTNSWASSWAVWKTVTVIIAGHTWNRATPNTVLSGIAVHYAGVGYSRCGIFGDLLVHRKFLIHFPNGINGYGARGGEFEGTGLV